MPGSTGYETALFRLVGRRTRSYTTWWAASDWKAGELPEFTAILDNRTVIRARVAAKDRGSVDRNAAHRKRAVRGPTD